MVTFFEDRTAAWAGPRAPLWALVPPPVAPCGPGPCGLGTCAPTGLLRARWAIVGRARVGRAPMIPLWARARLDWALVVPWASVGTHGAVWAGLGWAGPLCHPRGPHGAIPDLIYFKRQPDVSKGRPV